MAETRHIRRALAIVTLAHHDPSAVGPLIAEDVEDEGITTLADTIRGLVALSGMLLGLRSEETGRSITDQLAELGSRLAQAEES